MNATKKAPATSRNRRTAIRRQPTVGTVLRYVRSSKDERIGLVWNISTSGVSLLLSEPEQPGTSISGELMTLDDGNSLPVSFRVMHLSLLQTGDYCIGGQFERELESEEMKPFVVDFAPKI